MTPKEVVKLFLQHSKAILAEYPYYTKNSSHELEVIPRKELPLVFNYLALEHNLTVAQSQRLKEDLTKIGYLVKLDINPSFFVFRAPEEKLAAFRSRQKKVTQTLKTDFTRSRVEAFMRNYNFESDSEVQEAIKVHRQAARDYEQALHNLREAKAYNKVLAEKESEAGNTLTEATDNLLQIMDTVGAQVRAKMYQPLSDDNFVNF